MAQQNLVQIHCTDFHQYWSGNLGSAECGKMNLMKQIEGYPFFNAPMKADVF